MTDHLVTTDELKQALSDVPTISEVRALIVETITTTVVQVLTPYKEQIHSEIAGLDSHLRSSESDFKSVAAEMRQVISSFQTTVAPRISVLDTSSQRHSQEIKAIREEMRRNKEESDKRMADMESRAKDLREDVHGDSGNTQHVSLRQMLTESINEHRRDHQQVNDRLNRIETFVEKRQRIEAFVVGAGQWVIKHPVKTLLLVAVGTPATSIFIRFVELITQQVGK